MFQRYELKTLMEEIEEDAHMAKSGARPHVSQEEIKDLFLEHEKQKADEKPQVS